MSHWKAVDKSVLHGAVQIYGYVLNKSTNTMEVYSRGYSNIAIETSKACFEDNIDDIWTALTAKGITRDSESKLQADIDNVRPGEVVLVLQNFENNLTIFLKTYTFRTSDCFQIHYNTRLSPNINQVPYTAPFSSLCIIPPRLFSVPASHALSVLNDNIVALRGIDLTEESSQESFLLFEY